MFHIVLFEPEIPPNTGNIIRLCANTGCQLHLIHPLGFELSDKHLKRAGLDYAKHVEVTHYDHFASFVQYIESQYTDPRLYFCTTKATQAYTAASYRAGDFFVFGPETRGLPDSILNQHPASQNIRIPMLAESRSLNLSNATAIIIFEAWRQLGFVTAV